MVHELKISPFYFNDVKSNIKTFEVRKNDRPFKLEDEILFKEFVPRDYYDPGEEEFYTGNICHRKITYILKGTGNLDQYIFLGIAPV